MTQSLLLLDLDGVVVYEAAAPYVETLEIILLHDLLETLLKGLALPIVVLTHRSRAEAVHIIEAAGIRGYVSDIFVAQDLFRMAVRSGRPWQLFRKGLAKSWILPLVEKKYKLDRRNFVFIDDRLDNLRDLLDHGIGLALHAPSQVLDDKTLISFDFQQTVDLIKSWDGTPKPDIVTIAPRQIRVENWSRTGLNTGIKSRNLFNDVRVLGRRLRKLGSLHHSHTRT